MLITHGPPYGILDDTTQGEHVGCEELAKTITNIQPKIHVFGHIHEAFGMLDIDRVKYINASVLNERYHLVNDAVVLEM